MCPDREVAGDQRGHVGYADLGYGGPQTRANPQVESSMRMSPGYADQPVPDYELASIADQQANSARAIRAL